MKMFKDAGNQTYFWSSFSGVLAWLGDQNNLMILSLLIGIVIQNSMKIEWLNEQRNEKRNYTP